MLKGTAKQIGGVNFRYARYPCFQISFTLLCLQKENSRKYFSQAIDDLIISKYIIQGQLSASAVISL